MTVPKLEETWPFPRDPGCPVLPPPRLEEIREMADLVDVELYDGTVCAMATRYDDVRAVMRDANASSDGRLPGFPYISEASRANRLVRRTMDRMDPPEHDVHRAMLAAEFTIKKVRAMRPFIDGYVDDRLDDMEAKGGPIDLVEHLAEPVPAVVMAEILGHPHVGLGLLPRAGADLDGRGRPTRGHRAGHDGHDAVLRAAHRGPQRRSQRGPRQPTHPRSGRPVVPGTCIGAGNCADVAEDYFDQNDSDATVVVRCPEVSEEHLHRVETAVDVCPVSALRLV